MDEICYLNIIPEELIKYIILLSENKVYDLCLINPRYDFNENCKIVKIIDNLKYPYLTNINLVKLSNLTSLNLESNKLITNEGIKGLNNLTSIDLRNNKLISLSDSSEHNSHPCVSLLVKLKQLSYLYTGNN